MIMLMANPSTLKPAPSTGVEGRNAVLAKVSARVIGHNCACINGKNFRTLTNWQDAGHEHVALVNFWLY